MYNNYMIIFLYGPDTFRSKEKLKILKKRFINEVDKSGLNLVELEAEKIGINDFNKAIASQSFLATKRMVVIRGVLKATKIFQTEILELLKQGKFREGKDDNVLIFWDDKVDKRSALFKYLFGSKFKEEFEVLANNDLIKWVERRVVERGGRISRQNASLLASKSDGNLWALTGEIDKLIAKKRKGEIEKRDIEESYLVKIDDNIFNLTDAIGNKDKKLALKLINDQLEMGANEIYLLTMITRQFRILLQIKAALEKGGGANYRAVAGELKLHPFVVQKGMRQVGKYTMDDLKRIYGKLLEVDMRLKLGGDGKTLLEMLVVEV